MDSDQRFEQSLQRLKDEADNSVLKQVFFTEEMEQKIKNKIAKSKRQRSYWLKGSGLVACLCLLLVLGSNSGWWTLTGIDSGNHASGVGTDADHTGASGGDEPPLSFDPPVPTERHAWELSPATTLPSGNVMTFYGSDLMEVHFLTDSVNLYAGNDYKTRVVLRGFFPETLQYRWVQEKGERWAIDDVGVKQNQTQAEFNRNTYFSQPGKWRMEVYKENKLYSFIVVDVKEKSEKSFDIKEATVLARQYFASDASFTKMGQPRYGSIEIFGIDGTTEQKKIYGWAVIRSFHDKKNGEVTINQALDAPVVLDVAYNKKNYRYEVQHMTIMEDKNLYFADMQKLFSADAYMTAHSYLKNPAELEQMIRRVEQDVMQAARDQALH
ncbi:hypothetical protein [Brevibacillus dissolubilis]|uniref:hypothetical protein n=1 Tax=Brevibacillus dissolubilis TaxID=1844116 RepID=UPI001115BF6F|nr:hypothetical protein [Brevibacillus dissolubilis]